MLGKTHKRIVRSIAEELKLGEKETALLEIGSVNPDSWANFPHHSKKEFEIVDKLLSSRLLFLKGDNECYHRLGVALHYIQDRWTTRPRIDEKHTEWERKIESSKIINDEELEEEIKDSIIPDKRKRAYFTFLSLIKEGIKVITENEIELLNETVQNFYYIDRIVKGSRGKVILFALLPPPSTWRSPLLDLNFSYRICRVITNSVFATASEKTINLARELNEIQSRISDFRNSYFTKDEILQRSKEIITPSWENQLEKFDGSEEITIKVNDEMKIEKAVLTKTVFEEVTEKKWLFEKKATVSKEVKYETFKLTFTNKKDYEFNVFCPDKTRLLFIKEALFRYFFNRLEERSLERDYNRKIAREYNVKSGIFLLLTLPPLELGYNTTVIRFFNELYNIDVPKELQRISDIFLKYEEDKDSIEHIRQAIGDKLNGLRIDWFDQDSIEDSLGQVSGLSKLLGEGTRSDLFYFCRTEAVFPEI